MKSLVLELARFLVDHPDQLEVEEAQEGAATVLRLHVAESDLGRVIGRQGRTAQSLRRVLAAAQRGQNRFLLDIVGPGQDA